MILYGCPSLSLKLDTNRCKKKKMCMFYRNNAVFLDYKTFCFSYYFAGLEIYYFSKGDKFRNFKNADTLLY